MLLNGGVNLAVGAVSPLLEQKHWRSYYLIKTEYKSIYKNAISISSIPLYFNKNVELVVYIDKIREITTKDNSKMCFLTVSDEISTLDVVLFPKTYEKYNNIEEKKVARLFGRVEKRFDKYQLIAEDIKIL